MRTNENAKQTFLQHLPVPVVQVFDDFEILMHRIPNKFQVFIYSVWVKEVELSQTFIQ